MSSLRELAAVISSRVQRLDEYITENGLPQPSFDVDGPSTFPVTPEHSLRQDQLELYKAAKDLAVLSIGPLEYLRWQASNHTHSNTALAAALRFNLPQLVPVEGSISYGDLAKLAGKDEGLITRIVRRVILDRIFEESFAGQVSHNILSLALHNNKDNLREWLDFQVTEIAQASTRSVTAMVEYQYPESQKDNECGFGLAHQGLSLYDFHKVDAKRSQVFGLAMNNVSKSQALAIDHLLRAYDWSGLGKATVVDVGGGYGHVSTAIAEKHANLTFVVQDLPETAHEGARMFSQSAFDASVKSRISFTGHDMNDPQPVVGADVYLFRAVLHCLPRELCIKFLRNLIPALKPAAKIILNESCREPGTLSHWDDRLVQNMDFCMMAMHNANERTHEEWNNIVSESDPSFRLVQACNPRAKQGSMFGIIEIVWCG